MEFIGIDVHKRESQVCILAAEGAVVEKRIRTERGRFAELLGGRPRARILIEASTESEWVARSLEGLGHEVVVADPNFSPMYATRSRRVKTDKRDARTLAEACKLGAYKPAHRTSDSRRHLRARLAVREALVRTRTRYISLMRALVRREGFHVGSGSAEAFPKRLEAMEFEGCCLQQVFRMGGRARVVFLGRRYDGRRIDGAPTRRIPQGAGGTDRHQRARTEGRRNLEELAAARAARCSRSRRGYTPAPRPSAAGAAHGAAASAEARATCCRKTTRTNKRRCLTRGAASQKEQGPCCDEMSEWAWGAEPEPYRTSLKQVGGASRQRRASGGRCSAPMSVLTLSAALSLLTAAPAQPSAPALSLSEGLPAGFAVDGMLDEWKQPPSLTLGAGNQVAGKSRVASPEDFSAKVWLAIGPEGLALAGEVRDERVLLPEKPTDINADHVEVWLALPQPKLPPLAFANQFGEQEVPTAEACQEISEEDSEACRKWWKEQSERRKKLVKAFTVQYGLMPSGVTRFDGGTAAGTARYEPMPGGYRFEALIPTGGFPRTSQAPLRDVRVLVDLVDNDEGRKRQETFLSSSARRRFGDASTFHAVTLATPLRFGPWPELLEKVLTRDGASYAPGPDVSALQVWLNAAAAYQYVPQQASPAVVGVSLKPELVAKLGDVELVRVAADLDDSGLEGVLLVSRKGKAVLGVEPIGSAEVFSVARPPGLHILRVYEGVTRYLGAGMCGACPTVRLTLTKMTPDGRFSAPESLEGAGGDLPFLPQWKVAPDLSSFEVYGQYEDEKPKRPFFSRYTWNAKKGTYEHLLQEHEAAAEAQAKDSP